MRSPDAVAVKARCLAALPGLLRAHGLDSAAKIVQDDEGGVNPCFFIGEDIVVRFNARDPELPKFRREVVSFALARGAALPVPDVIAHDTTRRHAPYEALIVRRLPGSSLERAWPDLDLGMQERAARDVGELMARLHGLHPEGFGELAIDAAARPRSWLVHCRSVMDGRLADALREGVLDENDARRARRILVDREAELRGVERASLVHGDLHFGNILQVEGRVTGVVDFEWSSAGDPDMDLVTTGVVGEICPGSLAPLLAAYRVLRPANSDIERRLDVYRTLHNVLMCVVSTKYFPDEAAACLVATRAQLARASGTDSDASPDERV